MFTFTTTILLVILIEITFNIVYLSIIRSRVDKLESQVNSIIDAMTEAS